jgi:ubiquitin C-terminal hydrolase
MAPGKVNPQPTGLINVAFSCYQNSIIQALASLESLVPFLSRVQPNDLKNSTAYSLRHISFICNSTSFGSVHLPRKLQSMDNHSQQDAQEYYTHIMDALDVEYTRYLKRHASEYGLAGLADLEATKQRIRELKDAVKNPLHSTLGQAVTCTACGYSEGMTVIPSSFVTLQAPVKEAASLLELIDDFTTAEKIEEVRCSRCSLLAMKKKFEAAIPQMSGNALHQIQQRLELIRRALVDEDFSDETISNKCKIKEAWTAKVTKEKQTGFVRPANALVFHINRSSYDAASERNYKNEFELDYPLLLDMSPWIVQSSAQNPDRATAPADQVVESNSPASIPEPASTLGQSNKYKLRAVVQHYGTHNDGHYICYRTCAHPVTAAGVVNKRLAGWYEFNDQFVSQCEESEAMSRGQAFMLFYEMINEEEYHLEDARRIPLPPANPEEFQALTIDDSEEPDTHALVDTRKKQPSSTEEEGRTGAKKRSWPFSHDNTDMNDLYPRRSSPKRTVFRSRTPQLMTPTPTPSPPTSPRSAPASIASSWTLLDGNDTDDISMSGVSDATADISKSDSLKVVYTAAAAAAAAVGSQLTTEKAEKPIGPGVITPPSTDDEPA